MKPRIPPLLRNSLFARAPTPCAVRRPAPLRPAPTARCRGTGAFASLHGKNAFSSCAPRALTLPKRQQYESSNARPATELDHHITQEERDDYERRLEEDKGKQIRTPWHREGSDIPPVARQRSAGAMTKGECRHHRIPNPSPTSADRRAAVTQASC